MQLNIFINKEFATKEEAQAYLTAIKSVMPTKADGEITNINSNVVEQIE